MGRSRDEELLEVMPELLREARGRKGVSQEELADLAGVDRTVISRLESGRRLPSLGVFVAIAHAMDETPHGLLERVVKLASLHAARHSNPKSKGRP
jgi:transcriptional regulator with XRE-family HTH domain